MSPANIISFPLAASHDSFLLKLKNIVSGSNNIYESIAYNMVCDLEEMAKSRQISLDELDLIVGKAADILFYFRYDIESLAHEKTCYRASIIHQLCCGMLKTLRLIRPDLNGDSRLNDLVYDLYNHQIPPNDKIVSGFTPGPVRCVSW